tara:strand:+ start:4874 stop:5215 length:342 start_codon:yes stop_codon:yes gene_type:complete
MNPELAMETASLIRQNREGLDTREHVMYREYYQKPMFFPCITFDVFYIFLFLVSMTIAIACKCLVASLVFLMLSFLAICLPLRCYCIYVFGGVSILFLIHWENIKAEITKINT